MGVKERREREKLEIRERILDAARELFVSEGYDGVSMRKVAEKIEYSPTAIYLHFADKDQLFRDLCHADFGKLAAEFQSVTGDPIEKIRKTARIYADFGHKNPNHYRLMFMTPQPPFQPDERDREVMGNPEKDGYAFLKYLVEEAIAGGYFRPELTDAELIAQTFWAAVHGVVSLHIAKELHDFWVQWKPFDQRIEVMLDATLRGMLREKE